ncbi:UNVERIFIED_CONTAM: N-6 DNA methylase [Prevotella sp. 15_C9]
MEKIRVREAADRLGVSEATVRNWTKAGLLQSAGRGNICATSLDECLKQLEHTKRLTARANKSRKTTSGNAPATTKKKKEEKRRKEKTKTAATYEASLSEAWRNKEGIFYTPQSIVADMTRDIRADKNTTFLDPCCGCGNFIIEALERGIEPENVYGFDTDEQAVEIAKQRVREKTGKEPTHIVCADFLNIGKTLNRRFDLIYTNPPWGKKLNKKQKDNLAKYYECGKSIDTCSIFFFASLKLLAPNGALAFLLPEAVLNIATFESLRKRALACELKEIKDYGKPFRGVLSKAFSIVLKNKKPENHHEVRCIVETEHYRRQTSFGDNPKHILNAWTTGEEQAVVGKLLALPHRSLKGNAEWALGIVTGDNNRICSPHPAQGLVPIYRGRDISPETLAPPTLYIDKSLKDCRQVGPRPLYEASEKLIYRFVSRKLVFHCDTQQNLVLNSANILVPKPSLGISCRALASLLNSRLMNHLFERLFHTHKILRSDLETLPIFTSCYDGNHFNEQRFLNTHHIMKTPTGYRLNEK